jgi:hypothetical protein
MTTAPKMKQELTLSWSPALLCGTCENAFFGPSCPNCRRHPDDRDKVIQVQTATAAWVPSP